MSRQRIRASVLESSTEPCPHCGGTGHVRSVSSVALQLLRSVEETLMKGATHNLVVRTRTEVALYVLNHKRGHLRDLEDGFKVSISIIADPAQQSFVIDHGEQVHTLEAAKALLAAQVATAKAPIAEAEDEDDEFEDDVEALDGEEAGDEPAFAATGETSEGEGEGDGRRRGKRRRRRRGGRGGEAREQQPSDGAPVPALAAEDGEDGDVVREGEEAGEFETERAFDGERSDEGGGRRRRRGRRGGRRRRGGPEQEEGSVAAIADDLTETAESEAAMRLPTSTSRRPVMSKFRRPTSSRRSRFSPRPCMRLSPPR